MKTQFNLGRRFNGNIVDNPKNENYGAIGLRSWMVGILAQASVNKMVSECDKKNDGEKVRIRVMIRLKDEFLTNL